MRVYDTILEVAVLQTMCETEYISIIMSQINVDWFTSEATKEVYKRILSLIESGKKVPPLSIFVCDQSLSDAARAAISNSHNVLTKESVQSAIDLMRQYHRKQILSAACMSCLEKLSTDQVDVALLITHLENALQKCYSSNAAQDEIKEYSKDNCEELLRQAQAELDNSNEKDIIPSGFFEFDKRTGGLRRGNVLVLASVPGGGKSSMALQMALHQYVMGFNVCFISYEMETTELECRLYANLSKVDHSEINLKRLSKVKKELILTRYKEWIESAPQKNKLTIWTPKRELTIPQIVMEIKPENYDIVYIDYLSLLYQNPKKQVWENLGDHTRAAKLAGSVLNAALVVLAQYDDESNRVKYSKSITANANFVWAWDYGDKERETGIIEVRQLKARNASLYPFYLDTDMSIFSFRDYRGPPPVTYNEDKNEDDEKNEIRRRKKKLEAKTIAQKVEADKVAATIPVPEPDKRGIPKMPQLLI